MKLSLSEAWALMDSVANVTIEKYIGIRGFPNQPRRYLYAQIKIGDKLRTHCERVTNVLEVIQKMPIIREKLAQFLAEKDEYTNAMAQREDPQMIEYLNKMRLIHAEAHRTQQEIERKRFEAVIAGPKRDVKSVLQRYPRKIEDFTYTNVFGEQANVYIF